MATENTQRIQSITPQKLGGLAYAGEVSPMDAYQIMSEEECLMVDVRSLPEWQFTGSADLDSTRSKMLMISWKSYPNFAINPEFARQLEGAMKDVPGAREDVPLFFLCKTGGRSLDAAVAMTALGYRRCYNVSGGFEGDQNEKGQRASVNGWKAAGLPWRQG